MFLLTINIFFKYFVRIPLKKNNIKKILHENEKREKSTAKGKLTVFLEMYLALRYGVE